MSINKVILVGHVGKDPVVRYFDKGVAHAAFSLATSESYTNKQGETVTSTEWHNIVLWRALAEVAEKTVRKGSQLYITGKIKTRSYVDKDGATRYITEILADTLIVLEKKQAPAEYAAEPARGGDFVGNTAAESPAAYGAGNTVQANDLKDDSAFDNSEFAGHDEDDLPF
ncbi:MAG: single-stranded DNA-binding protein [Bacteroidales bacterium]|jgi:single-strand DNA-binding protein|nr:single-stranded DNA-binding protein [Bacteroidales bacterium]